MKALYYMLMKNWAILGFDGCIACYKHQIGGMDGITSSTICFSMRGV
jgi:hypothetical protein